VRSVKATTCLLHPFKKTTREDITQLLLLSAS